ncbi:MAG TPA: hypothetical protein PKD51_13790 [Saprospiraceae bacterium]|nr:hypothetical protein [Saprospiraceae bacterium]HMU02861.1 hypothetical protein [Saprospiraceae bacterium]
MNTSEKLILIDGKFDHEEAKSILMNIFATKIQFHELKNFSAQERNGKDDETAIKRIPELKKAMNSIESLLGEAKSNNKKLILKSEVNFSFTDE